MQAFWIEREVELYALIVGLLAGGVIVAIAIRRRARACADVAGSIGVGGKGECHGPIVTDTPRRGKRPKRFSLA